MDIDEYITEYILIGYNNTNYRCTSLNIFKSYIECYEINYVKKEKNVTISYEYDSKHIEIDCKETDSSLTCYMDDGKTVYADYKKEKRRILWH